MTSSPFSGGKRTATGSYDKTSPLTWTRDGTYLPLAGGAVIRLWVISTRKQVGDPWTGHDNDT